MSEYECLFIGKNYILEQSVGSTNDFLKSEAAKNNFVEGTVVSAVEQTHGRGQTNNTWEAEKGKNITLSVLLRPTFLAADKQFFLNMAIALGIKDCCEQLVNETIHIKWPNDIYFMEKKMGGVLIENTISNGKISQSVVGIGLNINQTEFGSLRACSAANISHEKYDLKKVEQMLFSYIEKYYLQLRLGHLNFLDKAYTTSLFRYQQTYVFRTAKGEIKGQIIGVSKDGKLLLESNEKVLKFDLKEIEYLFEN